MPGFGALLASCGATRVARSSIPLATLWKGCPPVPKLADKPSDPDCIGQGGQFFIDLVD